MPPLKPHVHNGRLVLGEPTDLPEREVIELVLLDEVLANGGEAKRIKTWWQGRRSSVPDLFERELDATLERILVTRIHPVLPRTAPRNRAPTSEPANPSPRHRSG